MAEGAAAGHSAPLLLAAHVHTRAAAAAEAVLVLRGAEWMADPLVQAQVPAAQESNFTRTLATLAAVPPCRSPR